VQAAVRQRYFAQRPSSQIIAPVIAPVVVIPVAIGIETVDATHTYWHVTGDHHDVVAQAVEGTAIGLFLVVVVIGASRWIVQFVRRPLSQ
jgi:hypothetical protein